MDFYNILKSFFGIPNSPPSDYGHSFHDYAAEEKESPHGEEDLYSHAFHDPLDNPMDMQRSIEKHIQDMLSAFGFANEIFSGVFNTPPHNYPQIEPQNENSSLRDQYLKPGFEHPSTSRADTDVDDNVNLGDLDNLMKSKTEAITPYKPPEIKRNTMFFGQSMSSKTVMKPDGSVETTKTVQDSQGNRETTVTLRNKDSEYTIITRVDKDGSETKEEKIVNFNNEGNTRIEPPNDQSRPNAWYDFWKR